MFNFSDEELVLAKAMEILDGRLRTHETQFLGPDDVTRYLRLQYADKEREEFNVLFLNTQNKLIANETMFTGTVNSTPVFVREVAKNALKHNAVSVIIAHNHPSGDSTASPADYAMTESVRHALETVEIALIDHYVVGGKDVFSINENPQRKPVVSKGCLPLDTAGLLKILGLE